MSGSNEQNIINHVAFALDASSSMDHLSSQVIKVVDNLIADMAEESMKPETRQETRVTLYTFADSVRCDVYDMDVTRACRESVAKHYRAYGNTALCRATHLAVDDLRMTPEKYGKHGFLVYVITDGQENASGYQAQAELPLKLNGLPDHWTMACLVPNDAGIETAVRYGFPRGNIMKWDATSERGVKEVGETIRVATQTYMQDRAKGRRGTKTLFQVDDSKMTLDEALKAGAKLMDSSQYVLIPVPSRMSIADLVKQCKPNYKIGEAYYQLNNSGTPQGKRGIIVQGNKDIMVMEDSTKRVATGRVLRRVAGLPETNVTVDPKNMGKDNIVFVQSTSLNRILYPGTQLLLLNS